MTRKRDNTARRASASPAPEPTVRLFVRRGAAERFAALQQKTADLPVEVVWDRRNSDRRQPSATAPAESDIERRQNDRRRTPGFTWEKADFAVDTGAKTPPRKRRG